MAIRVLATLATLTLLTALPARAEEPTDREKLFETFDLLAKDYQEGVKKVGIGGFGELRGFIEIPPRESPVGKVRSVVKVAARLYDPGTKTVGNYVSLNSYRWKQQEYFVLCFQSANPVKFRLENVSRAPDGGKPAYLPILPSKELPESTKPILPGHVYEFQNPLRTEGKPGNEEIQFVFSDAANPKIQGRKPIIVFAQAMAEIAEQLRKDGATYRGLSLAPPSKTESKHFDDVAVVVGAHGTSGVLDITILKKP